MHALRAQTRWEQYMSSNHSLQRTCASCADWSAVKTSVWRCQSCFRINTLEQSVCEKCGEPRYPDPDKADLASSKVVYFFQTLFILITVAVASKLNLGIVGFTLVVFVVWWVGLVIFAAHPVGGEFRFERRVANDFIQSRRT